MFLPLQVLRKAPSFSFQYVVLILSFPLFFHIVFYATFATPRFTHSLIPSEDFPYLLSYLHRFHPVLPHYFHVPSLSSVFHNSFPSPSLTLSQPIYSVSFPSLCPTLSDTNFLLTCIPAILSLLSSSSTTFSLTHFPLSHPLSVQRSPFLGLLALLCEICHVFPLCSLPFSLFLYSLLSCQSFSVFCHVFDLFLLLSNPCFSVSLHAPRNVIVLCRRTPLFMLVSPLLFSFFIVWAFFHTFFYSTL